MNSQVLISAISLTISILIAIISYIFIPFFKYKRNFINRVIKFLIKENECLNNNFREVIDSLYSIFIVNFFKKFKLFCNKAITTNNHVEIEAINRLFIKIYFRVKKNLLWAIKKNINVEFNFFESFIIYKNVGFIDCTEKENEAFLNLSLEEKKYFFDRILFIKEDGKSFYLSSNIKNKIRLKNKY